MSGSCRRVPLFEDLKLRREKEKREQRTTGVVYITDYDFFIESQKFPR
jgi:hypothetical protein